MTMIILNTITTLLTIIAMSFSALFIIISLRNDDFQLNMVGLQAGVVSGISCVANYVIDNYEFANPKISIWLKIITIIIVIIALVETLFFEYEKQNKLFELHICEEMLKDSDIDINDFKQNSRENQILTLFNCDLIEDENDIADYEVILNKE